MCAARFVLGVDGGGTSTRAWLAAVDDGTAVVAGQANGGPSNLRSIGASQALANLDHVIGRAVQLADLANITIDNVCLSLAGAGRMEERDLLERHFSQLRWIRRFEIISDAEGLLAACGDVSTPADLQLVGISLIAGTGSMAWGRNDSGQTARSGGWGYLMGDEGSGYWIGRALLQLATEAADGRNDELLLLARLLDHLKLRSPQELIEWCYGDNRLDQRARIASLCELAFALDGLSTSATKVIRKGANDLAELVTSVEKRLNLETTAYELACGGGVTTNQPLYRRLLSERLHALGCLGRLQFIDEPIVGAVRIAHRRLVSE